MHFFPDRLLTLYFFRHFFGNARPKGELRIPVLMYHSISDEPETGPPYYWISTSEARFAEHMKFLHDNGYQVLPLSTAVEMIRSGRADPSCSPIAPEGSNFDEISLGKLENATKPNKLDKAVVISFDDGFMDFYTHAFPILQKYGITATVFLPTAKVGSDGGIRGKSHLTWDKVVELARHGISFGSHTVSHLQLETADEDTVDFELRVSKETIENKTGCPVYSFSYPYRFPEHNSKFIKMLRAKLIEAGYRIGVTTRIGTISPEMDPLLLKRLPVSSGDDIRFFRAKLQGAYDWAYIPQKLSKILLSKFALGR